MRHVPKDACEQVHLEYGNTRLETTMEEMVQRERYAVVSLGIEFSIKHPLFALLVRHSEWILNHLVHNDFVVGGGLESSFQSGVSEIDIFVSFSGYFDAITLDHIPVVLVHTGSLPNVAPSAPCRRAYSVSRLLPWRTSCPSLERPWT